LAVAVDTRCTHGPSLRIVLPATGCRCLPPLPGDMLLPATDTRRPCAPPSGGHGSWLTEGAARPGQLPVSVSTGRQRPAGAGWRATCSAGDPARRHGARIDAAPDPASLRAQGAAVVKPPPGAYPCTAEHPRARTLPTHQAPPGTCRNILDVPGYPGYPGYPGEIHHIRD